MLQLLHVAAIDQSMLQFVDVATSIGALLQLGGQGIPTIVDKEKSR